MVEKIIKKIKSLPPLPESIQRVREICEDPEGTIKDLIPVVKQDPMFTADILKAANSPLYGFSRQITSIDQAVSLFGMGTIQGFAVSYAMRKNFPMDLSTYGISSNNFMTVSTMQNALTSLWGKSQVTAHNAEMVTLSLLMELGKLVAVIVLSEENKADEFQSEISKARTFNDILTIEKKFLSIPSEWIVALMFKHWKYNETMIDIMQNIVNPKKADDKIRKNTQILRVVKEALPLTSPLSEESIQAAYEKAEEYGLDSQNLKKAIESLKTS
ncbi:HDOD domain-containing protein [Hydrogenimonas thermophila]|uniref:HD-like signal output (HDOD) domain, no enzymatic activity n=1 Tax=Hydrogenimonas thermophila TaxID=223786 RepID=A0A1I5MKY1_9BACT|nr:HDOD domain-containing protein [Hydrogenimonas thermophila]SFP10173.1 HD-like signal output (HDOD) domain, no enzymatic activity [Hydrogenimonas thermophila]